MQSFSAEEIENVKENMEQIQKIMPELNIYGFTLYTIEAIAHLVISSSGNKLFYVFPLLNFRKLQDSNNLQVFSEYFTWPMID